MGRFKKESYETRKRRMDCPAGRKKLSDRCGEVAVSGGSTVYPAKQKNFRAKGLGHFELTIIETLIKTWRKSTTPSTK